MTAGDGLLVRVHPRMGRLTVPQAIGLAKAARSHGNGLIDLTNRAALQLRGVTEQSHAPLLRQLIGLGLADPDPGREARGNVLLTPESSPGDDTENIALSLIEHLDEMPELPPRSGSPSTLALHPVWQLFLRTSASNAAQPACCC